MVRALAGEGGHDDLLPLRLKRLLRPQDVHRRDQPDEHVHQTFHYRHHRRRHRRQQLLHVLQKGRRDPVVDEFIDLAQRRVHVALNFRVVLQHVRDPAVDAHVIILRVVHDPDHALIQLRQQHREKRV